MTPADLQAREAAIRANSGVPHRYRTRWATEAVVDVARIGRRLRSAPDTHRDEVARLRAELASAIAQRDAVLATLAARLPDRLNKLMTAHHAAALMEACTRAAGAWITELP